MVSVMLRRKRNLTELEARDAWDEKCLILFEEDDALTPDRETSNDAYKRLSGNLFGLAKAVLRIDEGDCITTFFSDGWFVGSDCGLGFVGMVIEMEDLRPPQVQDYDRGDGHFIDAEFPQTKPRNPR
jgi:hypothetical protein